MRTGATEVPVRTPLPAGFGALWAAVAVDLVGFGIVIPLLPLYAERFDASPFEIGLLVASFSAAQFVAAPLWGRLSDRIGRKPVLVASLLGTAAASLLTALAPNLALLFVGRVVDGASGGSVAVAQAAAGDLAPADRRPRLLGLLGAAYGIGFVAGPALGGLAALAGHRAPFLLAAGLALTNAAVATRRLRVPAPRPVSTHEPTPVTASGLPVLLRGGFLLTTAFGVFETTFALLVSRRLGLSAAQVSAAFVAVGVLVAITNARAVGPAVSRLGDIRTLQAGLTIEAAGLALLGATHTLTALAVAISLLAAGHGLASPALTTAVTVRADPRSRGVALGAQQSAAALARIAGPVVAGATFAVAGPSAALTVAAGLAVAAAWAVDRLRVLK